MAFTRDFIALVSFTLLLSISVMFVCRIMTKMMSYHSKNDVHESFFVGLLGSEAINIPTHEREVSFIWNLKSAPHGDTILPISSDMFKPFHPIWVNFAHLSAEKENDWSQ